MKLVLLYGPPAAGKLTVATQLSKKTGWPVFHNHQTVDLLKTVFAFGTPAFWELNQKIRLLVFERAAREKIPGLITTFVYDAKSDRRTMRRMIDSVERHGGTACLVRLHAPRTTLLRRANNPSRHAFSKLKDPNELARWFEKFQLFETFPFEPTLSIDTRKTTPSKAADRINRFFHLNAHAAHTRFSQARSTRHRPKKAESAGRSASVRRRESIVGRRTTRRRPLRT